MRYLNTYGVVKKDRNKIALIGIAVAYALTMAMSVIMGASAGKPAACATIKDGTIEYGRPTTSDDEIIPIGFDQWGYNYQARMFNGYYDNYGRPVNVADSGDWLMMKWNDAWLSNKDCVIQYNSDGDYGVPGQDDKLDRHAGFNTYRGSGAWLTNHASGTYQNSVASSWNVTGNWVLDFAGETANREFRNLVQDTSGNVTGEFWYWNGSAMAYGGTLVGTLSGDTLTLAYDRAPIPYTGNFEGTVGEASITGGTFEDSHGNNLVWTATGPATGVYDTCTWSDFVKIVAVPNGAVENNDMWYTDSTLETEIGPVIWGQFAVIQEVSSDPCGQGNDLLNYKSELKSGLGNW